MLIPLEDAGVQHCFVIGGTILCNWVHRKTKDGLMAMKKNGPGYLNFPAKRKRKGRKEIPPDLVAMKMAVEIVTNKDTKKALVRKNKALNSLK